MFRTILLHNTVPLADEEKYVYRQYRVHLLNT